MGKRGPAPMDEDLRFWSKAFLSGDCWLWTGTMYPNGYGMFRINSPRATVLAHRFAYRKLRGPIPQGMVLDHLCREKSCINPWHLEIVSQRLNVQRGRAGRNLTRGGKDWNSGNAARWAKEINYGIQF